MSKKHKVHCICCHAVLLRDLRLYKEKKYRNHFCNTACKQGWLDATFPERFWQKVHKTEHCWVWTAARMPKEKYGHIGRHGRWQGAHQVAWELTYGAIPKGLQVLHHCDTPRCVNPEHLFLGTHQDNMDDMQRKGRRKPGQHKRGEASKRATMTWKEVRAIRDRYAQGDITGAALAKTFGYPEGTVYHILVNTTWKDETYQYRPRTR